MTDDALQRDLPARIAAEARADRREVLKVFGEFDLPLATSAALPRPLQVLRLRIAGDRTVAPTGPFDKEIEFGSALTALVAANFKGKTSVLELITWCLRGTRRDDLQGVVRSWLSDLDCDAIVAGRPLGFRLRLDHGEVVDARVLSAPTPDRLREALVAQPDLGVRELLTVQDEAAYAEGVAALMLDLLNLGRLETASAQAASGKVTHGWPAYFGALYLPAGGDRVLLGDVFMGGLASRLLQVFLDLPSAALLTQVKATRDARAAMNKAQTADAARLQAARMQQYEQTRQELRDAQSRRDALVGTEDPAGSVAALGAHVVTLSQRMIDVEGKLRDAQRTYDTLCRQRQSDEKSLNNLRESAVARALFHALDPAACPRCETPITKDRKVTEQQDHTCAVCSARISVNEDQDAGQELLQQIQDRLAASKQAEHLSEKELQTARTAAEDLRNSLAVAERRLQAADRAAQASDRTEVEMLIARLEGMLAILAPAEGGTSGTDDRTQQVLTAAVKVLEAEGARASTDLFEALNAEIVQAARRFGMTDLDHVKIDRGARLQVFKTGGPREWFTHQSAGERLRLRIAVVVSLLRIGVKFGLATHPGLVMIDSPKAEEVQDVDATALLTELERLAEETPGLQIILTMADEPLVRRVLTKSTIVAPAAPGQPLW